MYHSLPPEILIRIFELVLHQTPRHPLSLLLVNSEFRNLCLSILHSELRFSSMWQLDSFVRTCNNLFLRPRVLLISLAGGTADYRLFKLLRDLLLHITDSAPTSVLESEYEHRGRSSKRTLRLKRIQMCLNSHIFDTNCEYLSEALDLTDPEEFIWTGPDPAHHFSIAIVPTAARYLFKAMCSWTNLRHLKLTNLSFPQSAQGRPTHPLAEALGAFRLAKAQGPTHELPYTSEGSRTSSIDGAVFESSSPMPHLQSIYLGQITFLDPSEIARIACASELISLTSIRVIDAYQGSIWGPRVRNADVEKAAETLLSVPEQDLAVVDNVHYAVHKSHIERIKMLVSCEALTERIMGGDRMDYDA